MRQLLQLDADPHAPFPSADAALDDPPGLLAWGGDLSVPRLLNAYRHGIFPWYSRGQPILWWSPDPRMVLRPQGLRLSRRFRRALRGSDWTLSLDRAFADVVAACASAPRDGQAGTWITPAMRSAYQALHARGHAHSLEVWSASGALVGGIYGVRIGRMFFGESMFSGESGASKVALAALCRTMQAHGMPLLDCQVESAHLQGLGAESMPRAEFLRAVEVLCPQAPEPAWGSAPLPIRRACELG